MQQIAKVGVMSFAKISAIIMAIGMFLCTLLWGLFLVVGFGMIASMVPDSNIGLLAAGGVIGIILISILTAISGAIMGFIVGAVGAFIYNIIAGRVGGYEIELK